MSRNVTFEVTGQAAKDVWIILGMPQDEVAVMTQDAAHPAGLVVMVDQLAETALTTSRAP